MRLPGKACCLTCTRLRHSAGLPDSMDDPPASCAFLGGKEPPHVLIWGIKQCQGFDPRPMSSYREVHESERSKESGAVILPPPSRVAKRGRGRRDGHALIVPPDPSEALIVYPEMGPGQARVGDALVVFPDVAVSQPPGQDPPTVVNQ